jgi:hypothetical protein
MMNKTFPSAHILFRMRYLLRSRRRRHFAMRLSLSWPRPQPCCFRYPLLRRGRRRRQDPCGIRYRRVSASCFRGQAVLPCAGRSGCRRASRSTCSASCDSGWRGRGSRRRIRGNCEAASSRGRQTPARNGVDLCWEEGERLSTGTTVARNH